MRSLFLSLLSLLSFCVICYSQNNAERYLNIQDSSFSNGQVKTVFGIDFVYVQGEESSCIKDFWIGKFEVTNEQWRSVMGTIPSATKTLDHPVHNITYDDAMLFINALNARNPGYHFRLPTKEEWQWAAHGGINKENYKYSGSDNYDDVAWMMHNSGVRDNEEYSENVSHTHSVGTKMPNSLGIYDMSGNVEEIYSDVNGVNYTQIGGSYWSLYYMAYSMIETPDNYSNCTNEPCPFVGLRLVLELEDSSLGTNARDNWEIYPAMDANGHEYVDLGLSVLWATCNVGASSPEEYGDLFAWGETSRKNDNSSWSNYKWCEGSEYLLTKYNVSSLYGRVDNKTRLAQFDDAACRNWEGNWRMPTYQEYKELEEKCRWTWGNFNGTQGYTVTSTINGNSIFLPVSSYGTDTYWTSTLSSGASYCAMGFLRDGIVSGTSVVRYSKHVVRPVLGGGNIVLSEPTRVPNRTVLAKPELIICDGVYNGPDWDYDYRKTALYEDLGSMFNRRFFSISLDYYIIPSEEGYGPYSDNNNIITLDTGYRAFGLVLRDNRILVETNNIDNFFETLVSFQCETWQHIDLVYDNGELIINNHRINIGPLNGPGDNILSSVNFGGGECFKGYLKNLVVKSN